MPEIKHDFSAGKMNKDLDERLVPNGEYRDAMNIQVRTTESQDGAGNAGTVQNIKGNKEIKSTITFESPYTINSLTSGTNDTAVVGSVSSEKNNKAYFFISAPDLDDIMKQVSQNVYSVDGRKLFIDYIVEVDAGTGGSEELSTNPIVVDKWAMIDSAKNIIGTYYNDAGTTPSGWVDFVVQNEKDIRVGMEMIVLDASGTNMLDGRAEVANIYVPTSGPIAGEKVVRLYTQQNEIQWSQAGVFIFQHPNRPLGFNNKMYITGINIIDDLLFWTDNNNEPKKINIKRCKAGTVVSPPTNEMWTNQTQLKMTDPVLGDDVIVNFTDVDGLSNVSTDANLELSLTPAVNNDLKEEHVTVIRKAPTMAPTLEMKTTDREGGAINVEGFRYDFALFDVNGDGSSYQNISPGDTFTIPPISDIIADSDPSSTDEPYTPDPSCFNGINYRENDIIEFQEQGGGTGWLSAIINTINITDDTDSDFSGIGGDQSGYTVLQCTVLSVGENGFMVTDLDANGQPLVAGSGFWDITLQQRRPMFELKLGRFSSRYKYEDGEYSSFGPWSEVAFIPGKFAFDHKKGYNKGMVNNLRSLKIKDFLPHQRTRPMDIVAVDILYKTTVSPNVYIVKTITRGRDPEWDLFTIQPGLNENVVFGELAITSEMIHKTLASKQLLRSWDNVPRKALSQEIAANRVVYGNYEQGYEIKNTPGLLQTLNNYSDADLLNPKKSIKSIRDYKFGMVFGDKYGRETPVIAPGYLTGDSFDDYELLSGDVSVEKIFSKSRNTFSLTSKWDIIDSSGIPDDWIEYVKYYVKETTNEYYSLVMDRWYFAEDGNIWISFASADRNKLDEETYLILKNEHGTEVAVEEKARYKIIAIENEAPNFVKRDNRAMGRVKMGSPDSSYWSYDYVFDVQNTSAATALTSNPTGLMGTTEMAFHPADWNDFLEGFDDADGDLEMKILARANGDQGPMVESSVSRLVTYNTVVEYDGQSNAGVIRWDKPFGEHADMLDKFEAAGLTPLTSVQYFVEFTKMVPTDKPEFDGKFFVKIEKDDLLSSKILKKSNTITQLDTTLSVPLAYIENSEYNPSNMTAYYAETHMPRRAYKWLNDGDSGFGDDEDFNGVTISTHAADSDAGGSENLGGLNVADISEGTTELENWYDKRSCVGTSENNNYGGVGAGGSYEGCKPMDAEFMGLGCWDGDGVEESSSYGGVSLATAAHDTSWSAGPNISSITINRVVQTYYFWRWFGLEASYGMDTSHGARLFIDGMRTAWTRQENGKPGDVTYCGAECDQHSMGWVTDNDDPPMSTNPSTVVGKYYKPTGIDHGVTSADGISGLETFEHNPTTNSDTLGRMFISALGRYGFDGTIGGSTIPEGGLSMGYNPSNIGFNYPNFNSSWGIHKQFIDNMSTYGTKFKFLNDPEPENIYMVVTTSPQQFQMANSNQGSFSINSNSSIDVTYSYWKDDSSIWTNYNGPGNPVYPLDWCGSYSTTCRGRVNWTNNDPFHIMYNDGMVDSGDGIGNSIRIGGHRQQSNPNINTTSQQPWSMMTGGGSWAPACRSCDGWPISIMQSNGTWGGSWYHLACRRHGMRFEFRKWDPEIGALAIDPNDPDTGVGALGIDTDVWDPRGSICHDGREALQIGFLQEVTIGGEIVIPVAHAACWETEPKEDVGLDIYYEASNAIPIILSSENTSNFAPYGSKVNRKTFNDSLGVYENLIMTGSDQYVHHIGYTKTHSIIGVKGTPEGEPLDSDGNTITVLQQDIQEGDYLTFTHPDGTVTMTRVLKHMKALNDDGESMDINDISDVNGTVVGQDYNSDCSLVPATYNGCLNNTKENHFAETNTPTGYYKVDPDVYNYPVELSWHNCWTFGNGVESDRIRDDFNAPQMDNGVKVSSVFLDYGRERRHSGMIYSGIYNSTSGVNDLNEFNMSEKITKDINPSYGSIQRLKTRDTDIVVLTEDKILKVTTNKDALFNADGNPQLMASNKVLGTAVPFAGDYGISQNPESLAWDQYRLYFTDMQRGAVLRLSQNGITPISSLGMKTWFRDNLKKADALIGTFDIVNGEYNLTLQNAPGTISSIKDTTVSFNEASKGWVSFKSFIPQAGESFGGKYVTAVSRNIGTPILAEKGIFEHHVDIIDTDSSSLDFNKIINRNVFYAPDANIQTGGVESYHVNSSVTVLFNDNPGDVKSFRTVNYEGSQAAVSQFLQTGGGMTTPSGDPFGNVTDGEYYNLSGSKGWFVQNLKTDLSPKADVHEFINKEGKWFNKIIGGKRTEINEGNVGEFSVQGIGILGGIVDPPDIENVYISITSDMVDNPANDTSQDYNGNVDGSTINYYPPGTTPPTNE